MTGNCHVRFGGRPRGKGPVGQGPRRVADPTLAVFATYATDRGRGLIDRRLYLPNSWCEDAERRDGAGVPTDITFQTKPQLATDMLAAAIAADVPFSWVTADEAYGNNPAFRADLCDRSISYVVAVACNTRVRTALEDVSLVVELRDDLHGKRSVRR